MCCKLDMAVIKYENEKQSKRHKLDEMIDFSSRRLSREAVYIEAIIIHFPEPPSN